nr:hypothetical protein [Tanacetum cinerariifolium]
MTTPNVTSSTDSQMHNNIMATGSRDHPPMLAIGRYPQWRSRFLRYINTRPNGEALRKCILSGPYKPTTILVQAVEATDDSPAVPEHTIVETPMNMKYGKLLKGYNKPEWSRFVTIVKQQHKLDKVSYHKLFDILNQYQNEVNELRAERLARNANPLALVATTQANQDQYYQTLRSHKSQKNLALIAKYFKKIYKPTKNNLRTSSNSKNKNVNTTPRFKNDNQSGQFGNQRTVNVAAARENVGNTDEEVDEQELEAHYSYMAKIQKVPTTDSGTDSEPVEQVQNNAEYNVFTNDLQHSEQSESNEQNYVESDDERVTLANLIADLKLDTKQTDFEKYKAFNDRTIDYDKLELVKQKHDELMKQSLLTKPHYEGLVKQKTKVITDLKLREEYGIEKMLSMEKQLKFLNEIVYKRSQSIQTIHMMAPKVPTYNGRPTYANPRYLKQAQSEIPCLYAFPYDQNTHANRLILDEEETLALEREIRSKLNKDSIKHSKDQFRAPIGQDIEILIQTCLMPLAIKTQNDSFKFVHELKQEMHADLKYVEYLEKKIDELESDKAEFSNMYDVILQDCVSKDVMCSYLMSLSDLDALDELQCLYLHKVKECDCLAQKLSKQTESVSKKVHTELLQRFAKVEIHSISLEIALQKWKEQNIAISELKKLIKKVKGKSMVTKFDRPSVVRQPNAQRILKPSVLGKPAPFSNSLERMYFPNTKSVPKANVSEGLSKPVTAQTLPQTARQAHTAAGGEPAVVAAAAALAAPAAMMVPAVGAGGGEAVGLLWRWRCGVRDGRQVAAAVGDGAAVVWQRGCGGSVVAGVHGGVGMAVVVTRVAAVVLAVVPEVAAVAGVGGAWCCMSWIG